MQQRGLAVRTINRRLACIKSLCSFALRLGYLRFSPAAPVRGLKASNTLGELLVSEGDVLRMLTLSEGNPRNHAILLLFYAAGLRASELCGLSWRDFREVEGGEAVLHVLGKGSKSRNVTITASVWATVKAIKHEDDWQDDAVFKSRKGGRHLSYGKIWRITKQAGAVAGLEQKMRPHILRHCNASHSLARGCPLAVIQATLGHSSLSTTSVYVHVARGESSGRYLAV
jgi:integrase/recombinase XerD